jgi:hypothetical protein
MNRFEVAVSMSSIAATCKIAAANVGTRIHMKDDPVRDRPRTQPVPATFGLLVEPRLATMRSRKSCEEVWLRILEELLHSR